MNATDTAASIACPKCQAANAAGARFCFTCGTALQTGALNGGGGGYIPVPPPPLPPLPPEPPPVAPTGYLGAAPNASQTMLAAPPAQVFPAALRAIEAAGGVVKAQQAPYVVRFETVKRSFWSTGGVRIVHDGELTLAPAGPTQTTARVALKLQSSSQTSLIMMYAVSTVVLLLFWRAFGFVLGIVSLAWAVYKWSNSAPKEMADKIAASLSQGIAQGVAADPWAGRGYVPSPSPVMPPPAPAAAPNVAPNAVPNGPSAEPATPVLEQLKQLGQLRDLGVVSAEEFEAKKAELLRRL